MLVCIHSSHVVADACYRQAQELLYWPGVQYASKNFVGNSTTCNEYARAQQKESMYSHELLTRPWQIISMDLFQYIDKDFLLLVDHCSDFWRN